MKEYILCAAIWFDDGKLYPNQTRNLPSGFVICGQRHHNCRTTVHILKGDYEEYIKLVNLSKDGFLTNRNRFVDRKEAGKIAIASGQIDKLNYDNEELFSEDLY